MRLKRARCTCKRCGKIKYLPAAGIDSSEPFLCEACDDKFIMWAETTQPVEQDDALLARFLRLHPVRR